MNAGLYVALKFMNKMASRGIACRSDDRCEEFSPSATALIYSFGHNTRFFSLKSLMKAM